MTYSYTVRSLSRETLLPSPGYVATVRNEHGFVVKQFPRLLSERAGHAICQLFIKGLVNG
jgi:hypothetical protein